MLLLTGISIEPKSCLLTRKLKQCDQFHMLPEKWQNIWAKLRVAQIDPIRPIWSRCNRSQFAIPLKQALSEISLHCLGFDD